MKFILIITLLGIILAFTGCAMNTNTQISQMDEAAFLKLVGNMENLTLQIDEGAIIVIDPEKEDVVYKYQRAEVISYNQKVLNDYIQPLPPINS
jgi:ABC-type Fe3+-hydroxamate transport system substrate-binding protein